MKFGKVLDPGAVDFTLPEDHEGTSSVLTKFGDTSQKPNVFVGCAKWNKQDLKNFYPRGTKDELTYYSSQFNSIELNATFYRIFPETTYEKWKAKTPDDFKFFPKLSQSISHIKRLNGVEDLVDSCLASAYPLQGKLGSFFLQLHNNFAPKDFDRVKRFVEYWPKDVKLAVEFRHTNWFNDPSVANELYALLEENHIGNMIVDTAGRRDLLHMRLTTPWTFVRYTGANHESDYARLDVWVDRIEDWVKQGIKDVFFFIHQNLEQESPLLAAHFIKQLNSRIGTNLQIPKTLNDSKGNDQTKLF